jgi:hypothetical protein
MNFSKKLVMCVAFLCVASFAQQSSLKSTALPSQDSVSVQNSDSQKNTKNTVGVTKPQASTWTKIKDMFQ